MKNILLVLVAVFAGYQLYQNVGSSYDPVEYNISADTLMIYGRDSCPRTKRMRKKLDQAGIDYVYQTIDRSDVADHLHQMMRADGISTRRYELPVVIWNDEIRVNPSVK
ncbi:glutaredoxin family protein [Litoribrevibacter euphylliae]|uniref:Glutaredoxin family protein n=1 Tax=Litoribrevibacter euphylliae TaxID=1834034 RepID=A0ABV7H6C0_9GAMM